jgi:hypothetical protein
VSRARLPAGVAAQHLDVLLADFPRRRVIVADALQLRWVDHDINALEALKVT